MSAKKYIVELSEQQRLELTQRLAKGTAPVRLLTHAQILLKSDQSQTGQKWLDKDISNAFGISTSTVRRVRILFCEDGLEVALNRSKPTKPRLPKVTGELEAHAIRLACSQPPTGHARWTLRLLADKLVELEYVEQLSYETVRQILKKTNSNPGKRNNGVFHPKLMVNS